jgi:hypothetical protein
VTDTTLTCQNLPEITIYSLPFSLSKFKLNFYGIKGEAGQWFKSYLNDTKKRVDIKPLNPNSNSYSN